MVSPRVTFAQAQIDLDALISIVGQVLGYLPVRAVLRYRESSYRMFLRGRKQSSQLPCVAHSSPHHG